MTKPRRAEPADLGPLLRVKRGDVVEMHRADPDAPNRTVRGARVRVLYAEAWSRGSISDAEREAADRYVVLCEAATGARERSGVPVARLPAWQKGHPTLTQVMAEAELRRVHEAVGVFGVRLLRHYVRDNLPVDCAPMPPGGVVDAKHRMGWVRAALHRAAEAWGMV